MKLLDHVCNHTDVQKNIEKISGNPSMNYGLLNDSENQLKMFSQLEQVCHNGKQFLRKVYYAAIVDKHSKKIKQKTIISIGDYEEVGRRF